MTVVAYLVLLQVWCRQCDSCWWEQPGRSHHMGRMWTPTERKTPLLALRWKCEAPRRANSSCFSSHTEHGSLTGFLLVSSRVSFHALKKTGTRMKNWWMVVKGGRADKTRVKWEHVHGFVLAVGTQVDCWAVFELSHNESLPGITLWWSHT